MDNNKPKVCYCCKHVIVDSLSYGIASVIAGEVAALGDEAEAPRPEKNIIACM